jgi:hypothetical protein
VNIVDDPAAITPAWLSEVLQSAGVDATVAGVRVAPVGTGLMASCYRVQIEYERGDGPNALVAKLASTDPNARAAGVTSYRTEVRFYRDLASSLRIRVPRCYLAEITEEMTTFTLLLEDMAPAEQGDQVAGCTPEQAREAAVNVAGLHGPTWCDDSLHGLEWLLADVADSADVTAGFLADATEVFIQNRDLQPGAVEVLRGFAEHFVEWARGRPSPRSLVHNDYRLDNLLFGPPGSGAPPVTTVDWQVLTVGLPLRDVAFLLGTGLDTDARRAHERSIVDDYHRALVGSGVTGYGIDACWEDYRYALFQGPLITVLGSYVAKPTERGHRMFTAMAERATTAIRDLDAFELVG